MSGQTERSCAVKMSVYRRYSTETAITRLLNDVYLNVDQKSRTPLLQLDLSAAFDTINQNTLKSRLDLNFGISGCALQWLSLFFLERQMPIRLCRWPSIQDNGLQVRIRSGSVAVLAVRVTDRQRHFRFRYRSFAVCWWYLAAYFIERWESYLSAVWLLRVSSSVDHIERLVIESRQVRSHHHWHWCPTAKWLISAMFIFNRRKVFAVLVSWLITRCLSMHTLTLFAKQLIV